MRAVVFLANGFEECEAMIVVDILRRAGIEAIMASTTNQLRVSSSRNIMVQADILSENVDYNSTELLILPGGRLGTKNLEKSWIVKKECMRFASRKKIAAICAAPSLLAKMKLLDEKRATCHPDYECEMEGAVLTGESVTVDGNIITGNGLGATFEFAFEIVKMLIGEEKVKEIKRNICYKE